MRRCGWGLGLAALVAAGALAAPKPLPLRTLAEGSQSGIQQPKQVVLRSRDEWRKFWSRELRAAAEERPEPKIDWSKEMVLGVFLGTRRTGGYRVQIREARVEKGRLVVSAVETAPGPGDLVTQALTTPYHLVAVKKMKRPVEWKLTAPDRPRR